MPIISKPTSAAFISLSYITVGALTDVWSCIWYSYLLHTPPAHASTWYWCYGFILSGLVVFVIGLALGRIARSARHAELPPEEAVAPVAQAEQNAAARAPMVAPVNPVAAAYAANGQAVPNAPPVANTPLTAGAVPAIPVNQPAGARRY